MEWRAIRIGTQEAPEAVPERKNFKVERRVDGSVVLRCAFCSGKGRIGADGKAICSICGGRGETVLLEPIRRCVYCKGSGKGEARTENSCLVCKGRGAISVTEPYRSCPNCRGKGRQRNQRWPCIRCAGRGIIPE